MTLPWWKTCVAYQIYPRSFCDSNGDGVGDLRGIISKLDYLASLGIGMLWLCPVYASPNDDNGYDISDYEAIQPEFGTLEDWAALRDGLHARGIRLVMDLVANHSSDEHAWFVESRAAKDSDKRDWYIWRPPAADGGPPNDWQSVFGGPAWELDEASGEYYLHLFTRKQPDLNWANPQFRDALFAMMQRWVALGIDGFRMDVINLISKPDGLGQGGNEGGMDRALNGPRLRDYLAEMRHEVFAGTDLVTIGETPGMPLDLAREITDERAPLLDMQFHFEHVDLDHAPGASKWDSTPMTMPALRATLSRWQAGMEAHGWNSLYLGNHDQPRTVSRYGDDVRYRRESAMLLMTLLLTLKGTPFIYQGDEIGMANVAFDSIDDYRDIETLNAWRWLTGERGLDAATALAMIRKKSRDNARTPMQWSAAPNAGFSSAPPWIAPNPDYADHNVAAAEAEPDSVLHYTRRLIALRAQTPALTCGHYRLLDAEHPALWLFERATPSSRCVIALNFSATAQALPAEFGTLSCVLGNTADRAAETLAAWEARILI
ncbi:alpha-glucosidase [Niveibacterium sp. 24ML]|uniref:alpha-glucosidase n=1 Tax=Niveibacterium sp. 24ML TaxID=2985512 RepID=UPI0022709F4F|nr:alpha-glucosidase [Niveibacterium sp. 24ML]MCX9157835.1 alpha-glucosidase [Niveibacterium sp. 24ML]